MDPIAAYHKAEGLLDPVSKRDRDAIIVLLQRLELVAPMHFDPRLLRERYDVVYEDRPADCENADSTAGRCWVQSSLEPTRPLSPSNKE